MEGIIMETMRVDSNFCFVAPNGITYGFWALMRWGGHYTNSYPPGFLKRTKKILGNGLWLHICSGSLVEDGAICLDISREYSPTIQGDAIRLPFKNEVFDVVVADPPYQKTVTSAKGRPFPGPVKTLREATRVAKVGGKVGLLHWLVPPCPKECKISMCIAVGTGAYKKLRAFTVFKKMMPSTMPRSSDVSPNPLGRGEPI